MQRMHHHLGLISRMMHLHRQHGDPRAHDGSMSNHMNRTWAMVHTCQHKSNSNNHTIPDADRIVKN